MFGLRLRVAAPTFLVAGAASVGALLLSEGAGFHPVPALLITVIASGLAAIITSSLAARRPVADLARLERAINLAATAEGVVVVEPGTVAEVRGVVTAFNHMEESVDARLRRVEEERQRLQAAFTLTSDGMVAVDASGAVAYMNPAAEKLLQVAAAGALGMDLLRVIHDPEIFGMMERGLAGGERQTQLIDVGPQREYLQVNVIPLAGAGEWAALIVLTDLTEVRRLEGIRREFVSNVSHELRTPLASIKAVVETLEAGALEDPPVARDFLRRVDHEVDRLTLLVEELLEISRLESGSMPLKLTRVEPDRLLADAVRRMAAQADRAGLELALEDNGAVPQVEVDAERVQRAVINLIHNALKFTPAGGRIRVWAKAVPAGVELHVADDGVGIAVEDQPRVFERFFKADKARSGGGSGLGLAIVKHVAQAHGGFVSVTSAPSAGSDFIITLPAAA